MAKTGLHAPLTGHSGLRLAPLLSKPWLLGPVPQLGGGQVPESDHPTVGWGRVGLPVEREVLGKQKQAFTTRRQASNGSFQHAVVGTGF